MESPWIHSGPWMLMLHFSDELGWVRTKICPMAGRPSGLHVTWDEKWHAPSILWQSETLNNDLINDHRRILTHWCYVIWNPISDAEWSQCLYGCRSLKPNILVATVTLKSGKQWHFIPQAFQKSRMKKVNPWGRLALEGREIIGFGQEEENHCGIQQRIQLSSYYYFSGFSKLLYTQVANLKDYIL